MDLSDAFFEQPSLGTLVAELERHTSSCHNPKPLPDSAADLAEIKAKADEDYEALSMTIVRLAMQIGIAFEILKSRKPFSAVGIDDMGPIELPRSRGLWRFLESDEATEMLACIRELYKLTISAFVGAGNLEMAYRPFTGEVWKLLHEDDSEFLGTLPKETLAARERFFGLSLKERKLVHRYSGELVKRFAEIEDARELLRLLRVPRRVIGALRNRIHTKFRSFESTDAAERTSCRHSLDYTSVIWFGTEYGFTKTQAACVSTLWAAWENRTPRLAGETILAEAGSESSRLIDVFKGHPAWGTMIVEASKGIYQLSSHIS